MTPAFSVVVPTYDRPDSLRRSLDALAAQDFPLQGFEVVIVDDGGVCSPATTAAEYGDRLTITVHSQANRGPAAARNAGARAARGDYVAFVDDDCCVAPSWLSAFDAAFRANPGTCLLGGWTLNPHPDHVLPELSHVILEVLRRRYLPAPGGIYFFGGCNLAARRDDFLRVGGFDERFATAEDRELCDRWLHRGGRLVDVPSACVWNADNLSFREFLVRYFRYGRGAYRFHRLRRSRGSGRLRPDFALFYWHVLQACIGSRGSAVRKVAAWGSWQVANAVGFGWELASHHLGGASARSD